MTAAATTPLRAAPTSPVSTPTEATTTTTNMFLNPNKTAGLNDDSIWRAG